MSANWKEKLRLRDAVYSGDIQQVRDALAVAGCDIHDGDDYVFRMAAACGHVHIMKLLIEHGARVHERADNALNIATEKGHTEAVKLLLGHETKYTLSDYTLQVAKEKGHQEIIALLEAAILSSKVIIRVTKQTPAAAKTAPPAIEPPADNPDTLAQHVAKVKARGARYARPPELNDDLGRTNPGWGKGE